MADRGIRPADGFGDVGVGHGQALDVGLVDDRVVVLVAWRAVVAPVEERVDDHGEHGVAQRVRGVELCRVLEVVGVQRRVAVDLAVDRLGVRVQQELCGVAAMTLGEIERTVNPEAIALARLDRGDEAVPHIPVHLGQLDPGLTAFVGDKADLNPVRNLGEQGEVDSTAVEGGSQGIGMARPDVHEVLQRSRIVPL
jgi:hypothetical protein